MTTTSASLLEPAGPTPSVRGRRGRTPVVVVGGGTSSEHDVSLASAASVARGLQEAGHPVRRLTIGRDGRWHEGGAASPATALGPTPAAGLAAALATGSAPGPTSAAGPTWFPVLHGPRGEDGALAGLLEVAGLPYVGSGVGAGALAMDKWATKLVAAARGVGTAAGVLVRRGDAPPAWSGPAVVKPVAAGSSHGVSLVTGPADLPAALAEALRHDDRALVEEVVVGREVDVAVLRRADGSLVASPALEVVGDGLFDTAAKYGGTADLRVPAALPDEVAARLREASLDLCTALGCGGVARVDFFVRPDGSLVLNEVNTVPGMTEHSQVPRMFAAAGWAYADLLAELVAGAVAPAGTGA